jgi:hypothetical protein
MVTVPEANMVTTEKIIDVIGSVESGATLEINGQQVLAADDGSFSENLVLREGTNIIEIIAQKKHSKQSIIYRQVIVQPEE